jgi:hypothetical protein
MVKSCKPILYLGFLAFEKPVSGTSVAADSAPADLTNVLRFIFNY